jgi:hypothetical protein
MIGTLPAVAGKVLYFLITIRGVFMQTYNMIKLKCFVIRMMAGSAVLLTAVSLIISIIQEMRNSYDAASRVAYLSGLVISAFLACFGLYVIYQAFNFEKFAFRHNRHDDTRLQKDIENRHIASCKNLVMTDQFVLLFSLRLFNMCTVIRTEDIIACFENPVYETITTPTEYTIFIYDSKFKVHPIVVDPKNAEEGHMARQKICEFMPWIFKDDRDAFMDMTLTKSGRRNIFKQMKKKKYMAESTIDTDHEAATELNNLASEAKEQLDFHSLLNKIKHGKK